MAGCISNFLRLVGTATWAEVFAAVTLEGDKSLNDFIIILRERFMI